ncbi:MAG: dockerin type I repeat-containing protein [Planctomycetes bacterium]|nr:dockerin type I repeat-containing protein [Planctomycetota bacterium]
MGKAFVLAVLIGTVSAVVPAEAQTLSFAGTLEVDVRFGGEVTVELACGEEILGWSFGIRHDPSLLQILGSSLEGLAAGDVNGGRGPDFIAVEVDPPGGPGVTAEVVVSFSGGEKVRPGSNVGLVRIRYGAGPEAKEGGGARLEFAADLGQPPVPTVVILKKGPAPPAVRTGDISFTKKAVAFLRGDANGDARIDVGDPIMILNHIFGDRRIDCEDAVDANDDGQIDVGDAIYMLQFQWAHGPQPPAPYPSLSDDPTPDPLTCLRPA